MINDVTHFVSKTLFLYKAFWIDYKVRVEINLLKSWVPKQEVFFIVQLSVFPHILINCKKIWGTPVDGAEMLQSVNHFKHVGFLCKSEK